MNDKHIPLRKSFGGSLFKAAIADNTLSVVASTTGNPDRTGDVIFPGAFSAAVCSDFVSNGFVAIGHAWDELPVAMPETCAETNGQLVSTAVFHTTQEAQDARTVCVERLDAGKSVSLSVGFMPDYSDPDAIVWFDKGSDMLAWAKGKGFDMKLFDSKAIDDLGMCRAIVRIAELFEWSIVGVGMNPRAKAIAAKTALGGCGSLADLPLAEHLETVLAAGEGIATRMAEYKALREGDDRPMSPDRVSQLKRLHEIVGGLLEVSAPITTPEDVPTLDSAEDSDELVRDRFRELAFRTLSLRTARAG